MVEQHFDVAVIGSGISSTLLGLRLMDRLLAEPTIPIRLAILEGAHVEPIIDLTSPTDGPRYRLIADGQQFESRIVVLAVGMRSRSSGPTPAASRCSTNSATPRRSQRQAAGSAFCPRRYNSPSAIRPSPTRASSPNTSPTFPSRDSTQQNHHCSRSAPGNWRPSWPDPGSKSAACNDAQAINTAMQPTTSSLNIRLEVLAGSFAGVSPAPDTATDGVLVSYRTANGN